MDCRDGDISDASEVHRLLSWVHDKQALQDQITSTVHDSLAADFLRSILQPNPQERPHSLTEILRHPYFSKEEALKGSDLPCAESEKIGATSKLAVQILQERTRRISLISARTFEVEDLSDAMLLQWRRSERILLKNELKANDIAIPTCFVIVNQKLSEAVGNSQFVSSQLLPASSSSPLLTSNPAGPRKEDTAVSLSASAWIEELCAIAALVNCVAAEASSSSSNDSEKVLSAEIKSFIREVSSEHRPYYLYLIDEFTMKPVFDPSGVYPIIVHRPAEFLLWALPLLKISLNAVAVVNGVVGALRCLGLPLSEINIPCELSEQAQYLIPAEKLNKKILVAEYDALQQATGELLASLALGTKSSAFESSIHQNPARQLHNRSAALQKLEQFFAQGDANCHFSGMHKVRTPEGYSCWTLPENIAKMVDSDCSQFSSEVSNNLGDRDAACNVAIAASEGPTTEDAEAVAAETRAVPDKMPALDASSPANGADPQSALSTADDISLSANTVMQALLSAVQSQEDGSYNATTSGTSLLLQRSTPGQLIVTKTVGPEGALLRVAHNITVEIPALAIAPGSSQEVSLEVLEKEVTDRYATLTAVSPILRICPSDYQFRRPVYVTVPHCVQHATKANIHIALFDSTSPQGVMRNSIDVSAVEFGDQYVRFPIALACDVVVSFRDIIHARHISADCTHVHVCQQPHCPAAVQSGLRSTKRQCRYCDKAFCTEHCSHKLNGQFCCDSCYAHSWTLYLQAQCVASWANSDITLTMQPCFDRFDRSVAEKVLRCNFRHNMIKCSLQINLNEREFILTALTNIHMSLKVPSVAVVMLNDATIKDQEPCEWRFNKYHEAPEMF